MILSLTTGFHLKAFPSHLSSLDWESMVSFILEYNGYFGFNTGFIDYEDISNRSGIDYGIIVGPAIEYGNFGFAIHHHTGFAWYPDKDAEPDEFSYANSKIKIKLYYKF